MAIKDLIATILGKKQLELQTAAQRLAEDQYATQMTQFAQQQDAERKRQNLQSIIAMGTLLPQLTGGEGRKRVAGGASQDTGLSLDTAMALAESLGRSQQSIADEVVGEATQPGMPGRGEFAQFNVNRTTPGGAAVDRTVAGLPVSVLTQGAEIGLGTKMGAAQDAQNQAAWANIRQNERQILAQLEAARLSATAQGQTASGKNVTDLIDQLRSLIQANTTGQGTTTKEGQRVINFTINQLLQQLANAGIQIPMSPLPLDSDLKVPSWFDSGRR